MSRTYGKAQDLIDFTRASSGTALRRVKYGAELVTNGTFDSADGWSVPSGWSIGSGVATGSAVSASLIFGAVNPTAGKIYFVEFDCTRTSGTIYVTVGGNFSGAYYSSGSRRHSIAIIAGSTAARGVEFYGGTFTGTIDNVSVKEVTFDTSDGDLVLFNHPNNIPRIEYDANGNLLGLLVEESRTNLITYSDDFSASEWVKYYSIAVSPSSTVSPDGQQNAYELTGIESSDGDIGLTDNLVTSPSTTYTASIWVKAANTSDVGKYVKLRSKRNGGTFVAEDQEIQLTSEWVRHSVTITLLADNTGASLTITKATAYPLASRADSCLIYRAQYEQGSFMTSAIPTSGSTATRSADVASLSTSAFGYRQDEGSVVVDFNSRTDLPDGASAIAFSNGTSSDRWTIRPAYARSWVGGVSNNTVGYDDVGETFSKIAFAIDSSSNVASKDGGAVSEVAVTNAPSGINILYVGTRFDGAAYFLNGHIKSLKYYPRRLTNDQLVEVTS